MHPSCSNFGLATFRERNFAEAMMLTSDRLIRCGHDRSNYSLTFTEKGYKFLDYPFYSEVPDSLLLYENENYRAYGDFQRDDEDTEFVKWLVNNGYYSEAILEINRLFYKKDRFSAELLNNLMIALTAEDRLEEALYAFNRYKSEYDLSPRHELTYQVAFIHKELGNIELSNRLINELSSQEGVEEGIKVRALSLKSVNQASVYDWDGVIETNQELSKSSLLEQQSSKVMSLAEEAKNLKPKSSFLAGTLSVIVPGLGYVYSGHAQTGVTALLVNALLAYATYSSIRTENYGLAALTGIFNLTFYLGNISGSAKSAARYNIERNKSFFRKIKNQSFL